MLLDPDPFLNELHKMYVRQKAKGSVSITMKRSAMKPRKSRKPPPPQEAYKCLIRANDGKKHVSTTVSSSQYVKFSSSMNVIMKAAMDALKKKEKPAKAKPAAKE